MVQITAQPSMYQVILHNIEDECVETAFMQLNGGWLDPAELTDTMIKIS